MVMTRSHISNQIKQINATGNIYFISAGPNYWDKQYLPKEYLFFKFYFLLEARTVQYMRQGIAPGTARRYALRR